MCRVLEKLFWIFRLMRIIVLPQRIGRAFKVVQYWLKMVETSDMEFFHRVQVTSWIPPETDVITVRWLACVLCGSLFRNFLTWNSWSHLGTHPARLLTFVNATGEALEQPILFQTVLNIYFQIFIVVFFFFFAFPPLIFPRSDQWMQTWYRMWRWVSYT